METIIVVDDDRTFLGLLKTVLNLEGYRAVVLTEPDEVVPTARQEEPVLIVMDVHIRRKNTLGALEELKQDEVLSKIPVIMTSGMDRAGECLDAGAETFLLKPFRPSEMLNKVNALVEASKA